MSPAKTKLGGLTGILALCAILFFGLCGQGCGSSALQRQATAARITRAALDVTAEGIETACAVETVQASSEPADRAQRCLRAAEGHDVAVAAWKGWISALVLAEDDPEALEAAVRMAGPILAFYQQTAEMLRSMGIDAPPLPPALAGLAVFIEGTP